MVVSTPITKFLAPGETGGVYGFSRQQQLQQGAAKSWDSLAVASVQNQQMVLNQDGQC